MRKLIFYKPAYILEKDKTGYPDIEKFSHLFKLYSADSSTVDRTDTIRFPLNLESLFPMPKFVEMKKTYEEVADSRARELLKKSDEIGGRIFLFYSGGIDSTLVVISFLKNANEEQKKRISILMTEESISENPNFYRDHIKGKLEVIPSNNFRYLLGTKNLFITGEHNDQIFGADVIGQLIRLKGDSVVHEPYNRQTLIEFYNSVSYNPELNSFYVDLFEKLASRAPVKIETNFHFLWWIHFSLKWQTVYMRIIMYVDKNNLKDITREYLSKHYFTFYGSDEFQLWSMNNLDKRMKDTWKTYKWPAKDVIYKYTQDEDYRDNKTKVGSLYRVLMANQSNYFLNSDFEFSDDINWKDYYREDNDFK